MRALRTAVSGKRNRYIKDGWDLDLTYITDRLIAMGFPAAGVESTYRNNIDDVVEFLGERHGKNYMLFNLSQKSYDYSKFHARVLEYGFPDHHAPPLDVMWAACHSLDEWLKLDERNVAVVHCKAGKGRTGVVIAAYMLFSGMYSGDLPAARLANLALEHFITMRGEGVTYPSQKRYVRYFAEMLPVMRRQLRASGLMSEDSTRSLSSASAGRGAGGGLGAGAGGGRVRGGSVGVRARSHTQGSAPLRPKSASLGRRGPAGASSRATTGTSLGIGAAAGVGAGVGSGVGAAAGRSASSGELVTTPARSQRISADWLLVDASSPDLRYWEFLGGLHANGHARLRTGGETIPSLRRRGSSYGSNGSWSSPGPVGEGAGTSYLRAAFERIKGTRIADMPLPPARKFHLTTVLLSSVPRYFAGGCRPVLKVYTAPRQHGDSHVIYNSAWDSPEPPVYEENSGASIVFKLTNCVVCGDVLVRCENMPGEDLIFFFSFHTSFVTNDQLTAVWRLNKSDIDLEKKGKRDNRLPDDFFIDMMFDGTKITPETPVLRTTESASTRKGPVEADAPKQKSVIDKMSALSEGKAPYSSRELATVAEQTGWLYKRGAFFKNWKRRWFVLRNGCLSYFTSQTEAKPRGIVPLRECNGVTQCNREEIGRPRCFKLQHLKRVYYFQAVDQLELENWVCSLAVAIASLQRAVDVPRPRAVTSGGAAASPAPPAVPPAGARERRSLASPDPMRRRADLLETPLARELREFYARHNPEKGTLEHIRNVMQSYSGREAQLWEDLHRKYPDSAA